MNDRMRERFVKSACGPALPIAAVAAAALPQPALASDWGCQAVLCLATPGSPTTYAQCVPPITNLWRHLATGSVFPTCDGIGIRTRQTRRGYELTVTRSDGVTARYLLDTRFQTVTPQ
ncbi:MAG: hypothetical protein GY736_10905 [Sphingomonas sp.]|jgi:hypothetical protein|uniref:hypothetical protein n=1 Tax=Sphingomonas TaxID=13687 RepID=UPI00040016ED|nr:MULTISPECIES: hypothetical protein [Sphingomonas]MCP4026797.1 hypothetical protein [Sphingomonas sp.]